MAKVERTGRFGARALKTTMCYFISPHLHKNRASKKSQVKLAEDIQRFASEHLNIFLFEVLELVAFLSAALVASAVQDNEKDSFVPTISSVVELRSRARYFSIVPKLSEEAHR